MRMEKMLEKDQLSSSEAVVYTWLELCDALEETETSSAESVALSPRPFECSP